MNVYLKEGTDTHGNQYISCQEYSQELVDKLVTNKYDRLICRYGDFKGFEFLERADNNIKELSVGGCEVPISGIRNLSNIQSLVLEVSTKENLSFDVFQKLTTCGIDWQKNYQTDLFALPNLQTLNIEGFDRQNLKEIGNARALNELTLNGGKVESLEGLECLKDLRLLCLERLKKLHSLNFLDSNSNLRELVIEKCPLINSYDDLSSLSYLAHLGLDQKSVPSLEFLRKLKNLESLYFGNTLVEDGDLSVLLDMPSLKDVQFKNKKNYSHKIKEIQSLLDKRN
jgi:hypothetical protein